jgi:electron transfer flavoprotein beta subunit
MKIVVPIKNAAALDDETKLRDGAIDADSLEWEVNEWDLCALEAALELSEAEGEGEVIAVSVGGEEVGEGLLTCLAMGADRALHIDAPDEDGQLDALAVARLLARAIEPEAPDLILCGVQSSDDATAATGTALAAVLGLTHVAVVRTIEHADGSLTVRRELEGGLVERLRLRVPALLTVQTGINEPRYATLRGIRQARDKPRVSVSPGELGFSDEALLAAAASRRVSLAHAPAGGGAEMLDGDSTAIAAQIATIIKAKVGS